MRPETAQLLLESIAADRLVVLCGAGLSMAPPSSLPSARSVANACAAAYRREVGAQLDDALVGDIESMARWFREKDRFRDLFLGKLVPWKRFNRDPNIGHFAIADFLACGVAFVGITTNFDFLVESAANAIGEPDFRAIVDDQDLAVSRDHKPFLKIHGCANRNRYQTIWCKEQLQEDDTAQRLDRFRTWLSTPLLDRDLLIVGFWSDWSYLSDLFVEHISAFGPRTVVLVDPQPQDALQPKAPQLWDWVSGNAIHLVHEQESGADFLDALRLEVSRTFLSAAAADAAGTYRQLFGDEAPDILDFFSTTPASDLYALRRDLTGTLRHRPVRERLPAEESQVLTAMHLRLLARGAIYQNHVYTLEGQTLRLLQGKSQLISQLQSRYVEEPPLHGPLDRLVCVGAIEDPSPSHIIRGGEPAGIVRPGAGLAATWVTHQDLIAELGETVDEHIS